MPGASHERNFCSRSWAITHQASKGGSDMQLSMISRVTTGLAILVIGCGIWFSRAAAQDANAVKTPSGGVMAPELSKLLSGLGYEPTKVNDSTWRIKLDRGKWSF